MGHTHSIFRQLATNLDQLHHVYARPYAKRIPAALLDRIARLNRARRVCHYFRRCTWPSRCGRATDEELAFDGFEADFWASRRHEPFRPAHRRRLKTLAASLAQAHRLRMTDRHKTPQGRMQYFSRATSLDVAHADFQSRADASEADYDLL
jgi:hypothetical protein